MQKFEKFLSKLNEYYKINLKIENYNEIVSTPCKILAKTQRASV